MNVWRVFFSITVYFYIEETNIMTSDAFYLTLKTWLEDISPIVLGLHLIPEDRVTQIQNMLHLLGNFTFLNYYYVLIIILRLDLSLWLKSLCGQQIHSWEVTREWGKINALLKKKGKMKEKGEKKGKQTLFWYYFELQKRLMNRKTKQRLMYCMLLQLSMQSRVFFPCIKYFF